jgi:cation diffusion facilitator CzcD-associated flavoprotein CzcO
VRVVVIGAGPGGICAGKRMLDEGIDDFVVLERQPSVGGTWSRNTYPGCECDVPSALYSFSFAFKPDWSKPYGTQPEILAYMHDVAERFGVLPHCRLGDGVRRAVWNVETATWTVTTESGAVFEAEAVISAIGMFGAPVWPAIEGLDSFEGTIFHSAQWRWDHDLAGERVAVIGSAASAVQLVPEIVKVAGRVHLFQRTANWVNPKIDTPYTDEQLEAFRHDPAPLLKFRRLVEDNTNKGMTFNDPVLLAQRERDGMAAIDVVRDTVVREKLRPRHPYGAKRPLFSNVYYESFNRPNLELVTEGIERITPHSVVTVDGTEREVDTIVVATGFSTTTYLSAIDVAGRDGRSLVDAWNDGPIAYLGIMTAGFPNLFMLYGPNTNNGSILMMIEHQVDYALAHIERLAAGVRSVDVTPEAMQRHSEEVQEAIGRVAVWNCGDDVSTYYRTHGRNVTQWPFSMAEFGARTAEIVDADFDTA